MRLSFKIAEDESVTSLSVEASRKALEMANVKPEEVDLLLLCTSTPDDLFGSAPQVCYSLQPRSESNHKLALVIHERHEESSFAVIKVLVCCCFDECDLRNYFHFRG